MCISQCSVFYINKESPPFTKNVKLHAYVASLANFLYQQRKSSQFEHKNRNLLLPLI